MSGNLFLNFFSIGALIPLLFVMFIALLLIRIRDKGESTWWLASFAIVYCLFMLPYFPASVLFHPAGAYHRWFTVPFVLLTFTFLAQFFFHMPSNTHPRFAKVSFFVQCIVALGVTVLFVARTFHAGKVYNFDGHYFDFDAEEISRLVGVFIILYVVYYIIIAVFRAVIAKDQDRKVILYFLAFFIIATIPPSVTNILSRDGALDRGTHQTVIVACNVLGFFGVMTVFLNTTRDRTTFMAKIISISIITFLTVFQGLNYFVLSDKEETYDELHRKDAALMLATPYRAADFRYAMVWSMKDAKEKPAFGSVPAVDLDFYKIEIANASILERIAALPSSNPVEFKTDVTRLLEKSHPGFEGYKGLILSEANALKETEKSPAIAVLDRVHSLKRKILFRYNKISQIPDAAFRNKLPAFIAEQPLWFAPFGKAMLDFANKHQDLTGQQLKGEVLVFLRPAERAGVRLYRKNKDSLDPEADQFVSYLKADLEHDQMFEVAYSYRMYRSFINPPALIMTGILIAVMLIVLFGFRLFFLGALVNPLNVLLGGVEKVNAGDMSVQVPIKVGDEIGFLSRSFNGMVASIREARARLEEYAVGLEAKVEERTKELRETLTEVQKLKEQQDGDYFLTSLLIKPLSTNRARSQNVHVDFFIEQKKKFQFRKWGEEIGGDICMSDNVKLMDKPYTIFLNADAMGKSIQGAGGALVLGSVFESIIERTKLSEARQYPEKWVKNAFIELHKVFESFEGSMLISLVLGLVDEMTGLMYYVNAEHPWTVLYRNGRAQFIEEELTFRKLGTQGLEGGMSIQTFQLQPGDILIAGSDGRDDLLLNTKEDGERVISEDEHAFLKHVEAGKGELRKIYDSIKTVGELTDDFSLVRIGYLETAKQTRTSSEKAMEFVSKARTFLIQDNLDEAQIALEEAVKLDNTDTEALKELIKVCYNKRDFRKASDYADDYIYLRPAESEILYLAAICHKLAGELARSADLAESLKLREPKRPEVLTLLAQIYLEMNNIPRARAMVDLALNLDPATAAALKAHHEIQSPR